MRTRRTALILAVGAALGAPGTLSAQVPSPGKPPAAPVMISPDAAMKIAIQRLREEGRRFRNTGNLPRQQPDFAQTYGYIIRPGDVIDAIVAVQDRDDAAVDAYIRWQLLSFNVDLANMENTAYERLLTSLPRLAPSPAANIAVHEQFEQLAAFADRNMHVRADLQRRWDSLRFEASQVELLNQPALKFRDAVAEAMPATGMRLLGVLLHDLNDRIRAACSTRSLKTRISTMLRQRMSDDSISAEQRWELIKYVEQLRGPETKVVRVVVFYANAPADVRYSVYTIRSTDVSKWTAYLNRHEP